MKLVSIENLKVQMHAKINMLGKSKPFMAGSFVRKANTGSVAFTVTSKVAGKTKSTYLQEIFNDKRPSSCRQDLLSAGTEDIEALPHGDTIAYFLQKLDPDELKRIRREMIRDLHKKKFLSAASMENTIFLPLMGYI